MAVPTSGLIGWYKADELALADGADVASWADASGTGNTLSQAGTSNQPTYRASAFNGKGIVEFDGVDDVLQSAAAMLGDSHTVIALVKSPNNTKRNNIWGQWQSGIAGRYHADLHANNGAVNAGDMEAFLNGNSPTNMWASDVLTTTDYHKLTWRKNGTVDYILRRDGTVVYTDTGVAQSVLQKVFTVGDAVETLNAPARMDLAELLVYNRSLTDQEILDIETHFNRWYPATLTMVPTADHTVSGFINEVGATTNLYLSVDDGATPDDDTTYIKNTGVANASAFFTMGATPADFGAMTTLRARIRLRKEPSASTPAALTTDGLYSHFKFDAGSGLVLTDSGPNALHHDLGYNSNYIPTWVPEGLSFAADSLTHHYPGSVRTANTNLSVNNYWTIHILLKWDGTWSAAQAADRVPVAMQSTISSSNRMIIQIGQEVPRICCAIWNGVDYPGRWGFDLSTRMNNQTDWFLATWTFDPTVGASGGIMGATGMTGGMECYLNGTKLTASDREAMRSQVAVGWHFGALTENTIGPSASPWEGDIGYFADYNRILTPAEIANDYAFIKNEVAPRGIVLP